MLKENAKIESYVLDIIERLKNGQHIEDSKVELKATLIDPTNAARRIAGHANAAFGQDIFWILGLSENGKITGIENFEIHDWFARIKSCFDEITPEFKELIISYEGKSILAIQINTSRAPYVIKNSNYGKPNSGAIEKEVPYREGTALRSARRSDLIRILSRESRSVELELLNSYLYITNNGENKYVLNIHIDIYAFLNYNTQIPLTIPFHKINMKIIGKTTKLDVDGKWEIFGDIQKDSNISGGKTEFLLFGPSKIKMNAHYNCDNSLTPFFEESNLIVIFEPFIYETSKTIKLEFSLKQEDKSHHMFTNIMARWVL